MNVFVSVYLHIWKTRRLNVMKFSVGVICGRGSVSP